MPLTVGCALGQMAEGEEGDNYVWSLEQGVEIADGVHGHYYTMVSKIQVRRN